MTRAEIFKGALRNVGALGVGMSPNSEDVATCRSVFIHILYALPLYDQLVELKANEDPAADTDYDDRWALSLQHILAWKILPDFPTSSNREAGVNFRGFEAWGYLMSADTAINKIELSVEEEYNENENE